MKKKGLHGLNKIEREREKENEEERK